MHRRRHTARGFATVEVLVAMAIFMLVGTLGIVAFGNNDRWRVASEAAEVAVFLQEARTRALDTGRPIEIRLSAEAGVLDAGGRQYRFARATEVSPEAARIVLDPTGRSEGLDLALSRDDQSATVRLDWLTGRVAVE
ncbi:MAG: hypothetical protein AAFO80_07950 [Pseudomonadota bacterium]